MTLAPGSAGQTFLVDVFATIKGDVSHTDVTQFGIQTLFFRGYSNVFSGGGAFATGATIGYTAPFTGQGSFGAAGQTTAPSSTGDNGNTANGITVDSTAAGKDGIKDFGASALNGRSNRVRMGISMSIPPPSLGSQPLRAAECSF